MAILIIGLGTTQDVDTRRGMEQAVIPAGTVIRVAQDYGSGIKYGGDATVYEQLQWIDPPGLVGEAMLNLHLDPDPALVDERLWSGDPDLNEYAQSGTLVLVEQRRDLCEGDELYCPTAEKLADGQSSPHTCSGILAEYAGQEIYWIAASSFEFVGTQEPDSDEESWETLPADPGASTPAADPASEWEPSSYQQADQAGMGQWTDSPGEQWPAPADPGVGGQEFPPMPGYPAPKPPDEAQSSDWSESPGEQWPAPGADPADPAATQTAGPAQTAAPSDAPGGWQAARRPSGERESGIGSHRPGGSNNYEVNAANLAAGQGSWVTFRFSPSMNVLAVGGSDVGADSWMSGQRDADSAGVIMPLANAGDAIDGWVVASGDGTAVVQLLNGGSWESVDAGARSALVQAFQDQVGSPVAISLNDWQP